MHKTTSWRYELQSENVETSVTKSAPSTWRKHPDDLHRYIESLKLQLVFVRLQRYIVGNESGVFLRSMAFLAREIGVSVRTLQRYFDGLEELGLLHRQEQRIARKRNGHNRFTLLNMDELYTGIRLSSSGRKFVAGYFKENFSSTKASTTRARRAPHPKPTKRTQPPASRGMQNIRERQRDPERPARFAAVSEWQRRRDEQRIEMAREARVGCNRFTNGMAGMNGFSGERPTEEQVAEARRRIREHEARVQAELQRAQAEKRARMAERAAREAEARKPWSEDEKAQMDAIWAKYSGRIRS